MGYYYEVEKKVFKLKPQWKALTSSLEHMFREEVVPPLVDKTEWDEVRAWPTFVADFEGDLVVGCYMAKCLMFRNHLVRIRKAVGTTGMRYRE